MPYGCDPLNEPTDEVRLAVGDTDPVNEMLKDPEVEYFLDKNGGDVDLASVEACEALLAKFTCLADETTGDISVKWSQKSEAYQRLLDTLKVKASRKSAPGVFAGGISIDQIKRNNRDEDRFPDSFGIGQDDNARVQNGDPEGDGDTY